MKNTLRGSKGWWLFARTPFVVFVVSFCVLCMVIPFRVEINSSTIVIRSLANIFMTEPRGYSSISKLNRTLKTLGTSKSDKRPEFNPLESKTFVISYLDSGSKEEVCKLAKSLHMKAENVELIIMGINRSQTIMGEKIFTKDQISLDTKHKKDIWLQQILLKHSDKFGIRENDLITFLDGSDVIMQRNPTLIKDKYNDMMNGKRGIIHCAENNCWPFNFNTDRYISSFNYWVYKSPQEPHVKMTRAKMCPFLMNLHKDKYYHHLSAGCYVGDVKTLKSFLSDVVPLHVNYHRYNQFAHHLIYAQKRNVYNMILDTDTQIFLNVHALQTGDMRHMNYATKEKFT